jgi:diguanylate cyclase (GGDEF)-like protein
MRRYSNEIYHILNTFYKSTGIGALCFNTDLKLFACRPSANTANDFSCLGTNSITSFISEKLLLAPENSPVFYTYFLNNNLVCIILLLAASDSYIGAIVTQPVFIKKHSTAELDAMLEKFSPTLKQREPLKSVLTRVPVRDFESLSPMGETLNCLAQTVFGKKGASQILCGDTSGITIHEFENHPAREQIADEPLPIRQLRFSHYLKMKDSIQQGDSKALLEVIGDLSNGNMPTHQLDRSNYIRSLKNNYIKVCVMGCYAAIEANAPYYKVLDLSDELIRQMEKLENVIDIFDLMKKTLLEFARAVEVSHIQTHSKPVRQVLDYIQAHYDEKLTLEMLAEQTGLSTFYLSTLIKKETGLMLMDNINAIRIEESKKLLLKKNISIIDIAQQVGFSYQNHFSTVFKKFTGFTPTEYVKSMGTGYVSKSADKNISKSIPIIVEQLRGTLAMLPEMYDVARIVDPRSHSSWVVKTVEEDIIPETCYDFWNRNKSCDNCISTLAYLQNRTFVKLDQKDGQVYMVLATPKTIGTNIYIIEVLKNVTNDMFIDVETSAIHCTSVELKIPHPLTGDELNTICSRKEIDDNLPVCLRRSKLEKKPFSIAMFLVDQITGENKFSEQAKETVLQQFAQVITSSIDTSDCTWAGRYTGDIFIAALTNTDYETASQLAEKIEKDFEKIIFDMDGEAFIFSLCSGVKSISEEIPDANTLVNRALLDLNAEIAGKQTGRGD